MAARLTPTRELRTTDLLGRPGQSSSCSSFPTTFNTRLIPASIRAGNWPPQLPWNPDLNLAYHYGVDLLAGLLTPPAGPDLAFTSEVLGAFAWTSFILLVGTILLRRGSWLGTLTLIPLLLSAGAWTLVFGDQPSLLQIPVPRDIPEAGLRAALLDLYWPTVELPWSSEQHGVPPNIWKPPFPYAYALALVPLERVCRNRTLGWSGAVTLAGLVGFLGLVDEAVAAVVLALWIVIEAGRLFHSRHPNPIYPAAILRTAAGPVLGAVLLFGGGGVLTGVLTERSASGGLSLDFPLDPRDRGALISLRMLPGGLGLLELGSLAVATVAVLLERRSQLVLFLAAGTGAFLLAALTIRYEIAPFDVGRLEGHARNFALLALLLALSVQLRDLRPRWRYAAVAAVFALVTWPTVATPARQLGLAIDHGVQVANAQPESREFDSWYWWMGRDPLLRFPSDPIADWLREHSEVDARVLSPTPYAMTVATGRPNASGFMRFLHLIPYAGPEYLDAIRHLEPAALSRLDIKYLHAPDNWVASLPERAVAWLANPSFFDLLLRDRAHALYRVKPDFLGLDSSPSPESYEALRRAAPTETTVYLSPATDPLNAFRAAAVLSQSRLLSSEERPVLYHLRAPVQVVPIADQTADLVVTSARLAPSPLDLKQREPVWWNEDIAVYAPTGEMSPVTPPRPRPFIVRLEDPLAVDGQITFTSTFDIRSAKRWTGQDWLVVSADSSPWALPRIRPTDPAAQWYTGQASPRPGTITHRYEFDPQTVTLAIHDAGLKSTKLSSSGVPLDPGTWVLGVRLRSDYQLAAFIPIVKVIVSQGGDVTYHAYEGELAVQPSSGPILQLERRL